MHCGVPPPPFPRVLPIRSREGGTVESPPISPPTHLQLLQFPEAVEDLQDGIHTDVKLYSYSYSEHLLLLPFFDRTPRSRVIDC
jgi:hypothetical protein